MLITNPYDQTPIQEVPDYSESEVQAAISHAEAVRDKMANLPAWQRSQILQRTAALLDTHSQDLAILMARESGKPLKYAKGEVSRAIETFTFAAEEAKRIHGETIPLDAAKGGVGKIGYYLRVPVGVVGAITPFNFPLNLVAHKVAPAIAVGCPIVLKPAPFTPLTSLRLAELMKEAGLPNGAFEVVTGGADVGKWLTSDPRIAMISFTGSPPVARAISQIAGLRRTTFELGGNAATIVDENSNLDHALQQNVMAAFAYSGQICISVQRIYVHRAIYDTFKEDFLARTAKLKQGDPLDDKTDLSAVINTSAAERINAWIREAQEAGARVLAGGVREGTMLPPTVLENVTREMKVMSEEVFGPVVCLIPFDDFDAAIDAVNDSRFGLQTGVYTRDLNKAFRAVQRLNVGGVLINDAPIFRVDHMPYGGNKESGVGREGPRFAIEDMTTLKMVVVNIGV
jgi:acyl-CoA reductase-like NAD-dependent aldehyde dehydrogenase